MLGWRTITKLWSLPSSVVRKTQRLLKPSLLTHGVLVGKFLSPLMEANPSFTFYDNLLTKVADRLVRDDYKLPDDSREEPNPVGLVSSSIFGHELVYILDGKLVKWASASSFPKGK